MFAQTNMYRAKMQYCTKINLLDFARVLSCLLVVVSMKIMGCLKDDKNDENEYHMGGKPSTKINIFAYEYKIQCKIGEGSFSEVLKCIDRHSGVAIAAKQLKKSFKSASHAYETPELVAMRKLTRHPNILHMIESHYDQLTGKVTLVFELMDMSLYDLVKNRKKPIPEAKAKNFLYQIVKGVDHIHHHGIFHRDIKPENILVKGDLLKISDLGSIKGIYTRHPYTEYISTRWYRSPECLLTSGYYGPKMDVWAIGCVFFELLTLKPLFPGSNELDQVAKINHVLGTPSNRLMDRFRRHSKVRNNEIQFIPKQGTGLNPLIPFISEFGRDILKQMIVYDPDARSNIRRLIEHKYFLEFRQTALSQKYSVSSIPGVPKTSWRNPVLLSYLTSGKKKKLKKDKAVLINEPDEISPNPSEISSKLSMAEMPSGVGGPDGMAPAHLPVRNYLKGAHHKVGHGHLGGGVPAAEPQLQRAHAYLGISNPALDRLKERLNAQRQEQRDIIMNKASHGESKSHLCLPDNHELLLRNKMPPSVLKSTSFLPRISEKGDGRKETRRLTTITTTTTILGK